MKTRIEHKETLILDDGIEIVLVEYSGEIEHLPLIEQDLIEYDVTGLRPN